MNTMTSGTSVGPGSPWQDRRERGTANGYASLDANGDIPATQLPDATTTARGAVLQASAVTVPAVSAAAMVDNSTGASGGSPYTLSAAGVAYSAAGENNSRAAIVAAYNALRADVLALRAAVEELRSTAVTAGQRTT